MVGHLKAWFAATVMSLAFLVSHGATAQSADLEANKKLAYEAIELWLSGTKVKPEAIFTADYKNHVDSQVGPKSGPQLRRLAEFKADLARFHAAFSDVKAMSRSQVAQGDMVATRVVLSAVHSGSFLNEKPTGKTIRYDSVEFVRIKDGKIAETWVTWDKYSMFQQIGLIK